MGSLPSLGSLCDRGYEVLGGTAYQMQAISREVFSLPSGSVLTLQIISLWGFLLYLRRDFLCSRLSYYSVEEEKIK